jgi:hypothetical protein
VDALETKRCREYPTHNKPRNLSLHSLLKYQAVKLPPQKYLDAYLR